MWIYFEIGPVVQEGCCLMDFLSRAVAAFMFGRAEPAYLYYVWNVSIKFKNVQN